MRTRLPRKLSAVLGWYSAAAAYSEHWNTEPRTTIREQTRISSLAPMSSSLCGDQKVHVVKT